ncbi:MAG: DUF4832 domain-containing protein [Armatimonadetes bacterium]|nr:DUF4832 domain-containing protein [Armatimonadota bacterium]
MPLLRGVGTVAFALAFGLAAARGATVTITPTAIDDVFANPGMGWQTFHHTKLNDPNNADISSAAAYYRFYWRDLEPADGQLDFAMLDQLLADCHQAGQRLSFRVMCVGTDNRDIHCPPWLRDLGCRGFTFRYGNANHDTWCPDWEDPLFQERHHRLLAALAARYDGHPDVDTVDMGTVGLWGEWHMSGTKVPMPRPETALMFIDWYRELFAKTPKVMLIGPLEGLKHAVAHGCGWRADCLGDMGGFSATWNHMRDMYPHQLVKAEAGDAWKTAPVAWETCWDMRKWVDEGWDVHAIFDYALQCHGSYLNNKSAPIPDGAQPEIDRLLRKLGYRLVLKRAEHDDRAAAGARLTVRTAWENVGVAPPYHEFVLALRLRDAAQNMVIQTTTTSIRGWLPGAHEAEFAADLPAGLKAGDYTLSLGVVAPGGRVPVVRLAIAGRDEEGWYPLGGVRVE